jgi:hypothetical protein
VCYEGADLNPWTWTATVLLDRSLSMQTVLPGSKTSKWDGVRSGLAQLSNEPQGFLRQLSLMTFAPIEDTRDPCDWTSYETSATTPQASPKLNVNPILAVFDSLLPNSFLRPTAAALDAAIRDAQNTASQWIGATPIAILITDGLPYGCSSGTELERLADVVSAVNIPTVLNYTLVYVIQLGDGYDLSPVADAGKTGTAYVISGGAIDRQLVRILRRILYPVLPNCSAWRTIPWNQVRGATVLDFEIEMQSAYASDRLSPLRLQSEQDCAQSPAGGFWVKNSVEDQAYVIGLCPCTCAAMGTDQLSFYRVICDR